MSSIIDSYYLQHQELSGFLEEKSEISLKSDADKKFSKTLILASASYFEARVLSIVNEFCSHHARSNEMVMSLLKAKAFERQYHSFFDWKVNNVNKFFSQFGEGAKLRHMENIKDNESLKKQEKNFMFIGSKRNLLVHTNFVVSPLEETYLEIYERYKSANLFVDYIEKFFQDRRAQ
ncbi:MAG: hypothetical protein JWM78_3617 [Verrucomicrobiaceae bacterium]|nr:hypothetical protein [Verrucomicrobiaceae bacterium]